TCDPSLVRAVLSQLSYPPQEYFYTTWPDVLSTKLAKIPSCFQKQNLSSDMSASLFRREKAA
ncbi:MAG: hypothetical protein M0Z60_07165, partial [Nitrospiraceae bacterium]|nr:hypothetical protein [Nitrospiraceae bacterium]